VRLQKRSRLFEIILSDHEHLSLSQDAAFLEAAEDLYGLAPFGYIATAGSGSVLLINETLLGWLGYTREELRPGVRLPDLLTPGGRLFYETHLAPILMADGSAEEVALDLVSKQGGVIPTLVNVRQSRDRSNGRLLNRWTIFRATERRMYERELVSARNLFETTLSSIGDGVVTTDAAGAVTFLNGVAADLSGWDPDLAIGRPIEDVLILTREDTGGPIENPIRQALRMRARVGLDNHTKLLSKDGRLCVVDDSAAPILNEDGELFGAVMVFRDVTRRREAERALGAAYHELEVTAAELRRSNGDLSEFAYVASHDLRSPLKTVTMYSQLLQRRYGNKLDAEGKELLSEIEGATKRLGALIEDLLEFSTVSSEREYSLTPIDAELALGMVLDNLRAIITDSGATVDSGPLPKVRIGTTSLIQLLQNLVANAIRYRSAAPPLISISAQLEGAFWHFYCRDNGVGISPEHYQRIFEPFKRLHGHEIPGSGIGLALCRKIVDRYGGRIWVESIVGEGSTFQFTLPVTADQSRGTQ
jgi:PAS domain S-box-containing protein